MISRIALLLLCMCLVTAIAQAAENNEEIYERAVEAVDFDFEQDWAYTETWVTSEHVWVGRYDPRRTPGERWQLQSVDDRKPSDDEFEEFYSDKEHDHSDRGGNRVNAMVEPGSVRLIDENDDFWLFGFDPGEHEIMDSVDATIRVSKSDGHLEYIDIRNHSTIKPGFGVKISRLITRLTFGPAVDEGPIVPLTTQVEVQGRAFLIVSFDEEELFQNSDFEFVGNE